MYKKKSWLGVLILVTIFVITACSSGEDSNNMPSPGNMDKEKETEISQSNVVQQNFQIIDSAKAKEMMDAGNVVIVDVRTTKEYEQEHIKDAISVPNESITQEKPQALPDEEVTLLVYCRTGVRAQEASEKLAALGYKNVYDFGGIVDWPYETVKGEQ